MWFNLAPTGELCCSVQQIGSYQNQSKGFMTSRKDVQKVSLKVSLKVCFLSSDLDNTARINAIIKQITVYDRTTISTAKIVSILTKLLRQIQV